MTNAVEKTNNSTNVPTSITEIPILTTIDLGCAKKYFTKFNIVYIPEKDIIGINCIKNDLFID